MSASILIADDEPNQLELLSFNLSKAGYVVHKAHDGRQAAEMAELLQPDLVILDWMMPELSGIDVCKLIRKSPELSKTPVIMLSARGEEGDKTFGLDIGADDYITKPFSQKLLIERIRAVLRRSSLSTSTDPEKIIQRGDLMLDIDRHISTWKNVDVRLTVTEFLILQSLVSRPGLVKSRDQLMDVAYGETIYVDDRTIDSHIKRMRRKFKHSDKEFDKIETLYGIGYRYRDNK